MEQQALQIAKQKSDVEKKKAKELLEIERKRQAAEAARIRQERIEKQKSVEKAKSDNSSPAAGSNKKKKVVIESSSEDDDEDV